MGGDHDTPVLEATSIDRDLNEKGEFHGDWNSAIKPRDELTETETEADGDGSGRDRDHGVRGDQSRHRAEQHKITFKN